MTTKGAALATISMILGCDSLLSFDDWQPSTVQPSASSSVTTGSGGLGGDGGNAGASTGGDGGCGNTASDPDHCGRCGTSCLGGSCADGVCLPIVLASENEPMFQFGHLALDGAYVYWTRSGAMLRLPKDQSTAPMEIVGPTYLADLPVVDAGVVYWSSYFGGQIGKLEQGSITILSTGEAFPFGLTLLDGVLYWSQFELAQPIRKISVTGAPPAQDATAPIAKPMIVAHDGADLFYTYAGASRFAGGVDSLAGAQLAEDEDEPSGIAVDSTHVWFATHDGKLKRVPKSGGLTETLFATPVDPDLFIAEIALDATDAYWATEGETLCADAQPCPCSPACGQVMSVPLGGGAPKVFAAGDWGGIACLAVDGEAVYWTTNEPTRLFRKAKQ